MCLRKLTQRDPAENMKETKASSDCIHIQSRTIDKKGITVAVPDEPVAVVVTSEHGLSKHVLPVLNEQHVFRQVVVVQVPARVGRLPDDEGPGQAVRPLKAAVRVVIVGSRRARFKPEDKKNKMLVTVSTGAHVTSEKIFRQPSRTWLDGDA